MRARIVTALALLCVLRGQVPAAEVDAKSAPLRFAVDRNGNRPVPVITARDHCAWPNLKLLKDGRTLAALIFNDASHGHHPGDIECWLSGDGGRRGSSAAR